MEKFEYCLNLFFYICFRWERLNSQLINYCIDATWVKFLSTYIPERYHTKGMKEPELRKVWVDKKNIYFTSICALGILWMNIAFVTAIIGAVTKEYLNLDYNFFFEYFLCINIPYIWGLWIVLEYYTERKNNYLQYFQMFERKSKLWKKACTVSAFLLIIESLSFVWLMFLFA